MIEKLMTNYSKCWTCKKRESRRSYCNITYYHSHFVKLYQQVCCNPNTCEQSFQIDKVLNNQIKAMIRQGFQACSGLKINFHKSSLIEIGSLMNQLNDIVLCQDLSRFLFPSPILGFPFTSKEPPTMTGQQLLINLMLD